LKTLVQYSDNNPISDEVISERAIITGFRKRAKGSDVRVDRFSHRLITFIKQVSLINLIRVSHIKSFLRTTRNIDVRFLFTIFKNQSILDFQGFLTNTRKKGFKVKLFTFVS